MLGLIILFIGLVLLSWVILYKYSSGLRLVVFKEEEEPKMVLTSFFVLVVSILLLTIYIHFF